MGNYLTLIDMKNIISKLVFVSLLMVVITGFNVAQGQSMTLLITDNTGGGWNRKIRFRNKRNIPGRVPVTVCLLLNGFVI